jgi:two-component system, OmpR family, phosphate regulon sensor histidine kinase PhoR
MLKFFIFIGLVINIVSYLYFSYPLSILFINIALLLLVYLFKEIKIEESSDKNNLIINNDSLLNTNLQEFFVNHLQEIVIIINKFNIITFANSQALNFFGNKLLGQNIGSELRIPDLLDAIDHNRQDKLIKKIDLEIKLPTYKYLKADVISAELENVIIIMRDYTEVKKSQDLRSDFVANVSHELKTPLTSIKGFLEVIETSAKDDPQMQKKSIKIMLTQANKMQILIDDLLMLNRIEQQEHIKLRDRVSVNEVLKEVISNYSELANEKKINIKFINSKKDFIVKGDKEKLTVLFKNILDNSIKYSLPSTEIICEMNSKNGKVLIMIEDQGIGIPKKDILRITERFYRSDNGKKLKIEGTGIGLSIVKHIINQHEGELRISSVEGKGSEFIVELQEFENS